MSVTTVKGFGELLSEATLGKKCEPLPKKISKRGLGVWLK
jgi:hypothetical protein